MDDLGHLVQSQIVANLSKSKELSTLLKNKGSKRGFHSINQFWFPKEEHFNNLKNIFPL